MIRISNTDTYGWEAAIRGMRNPMNSWADSDSTFQKTFAIGEDGSFMQTLSFCIGAKDLKVMQNLIRPGTGDHRKYLRYIDVWVDVEAPLYWWKEFDTYRMGVHAPDATEIEMNSCSTMHKIHAKMFEFDDFSCENLTKTSKNCLEVVINRLNHCRAEYIESGKKDKNRWEQLIQLLPSSYNQKRTLKLNYEVLRNMYHARKNHKLDEWREFCKWVESLPYAKELICWEN